MLSVWTRRRFASLGITFRYFFHLCCRVNKNHSECWKLWDTYKEHTEGRKSKPHNERTMLCYYYFSQKKLAITHVFIITWKAAGAKCWRCWRAAERRDGKLGRILITTMNICELWSNIGWCVKISNYNLLVSSVANWNYTLESVLCAAFRAQKVVMARTRKKKKS